MAHIRLASSYSQMKPVENPKIMKLIFVRNGQQGDNFNITSTDYTSQGGNIIQPTITQQDGYVEIETTHTAFSGSWWDCILYNTLSNEQITAIKNSNHCLVNAEFIYPIENYATNRMVALYNGTGSAPLIMLYDSAEQTATDYKLTLSQDFTINPSSLTFNRVIIGSQKQANQSLGTYKIRIKDLYFYWKG